MQTWPDSPLLLDGGMGRELRFRGVEILDAIWSANGLIVAPEIVHQVHLDYIAAGADVITTG
jgi:S-methylmethionine-dependent homocysteine/selenocysteine methylase